jgi:hypothetical protein
VGLLRPSVGRDSISDFTTNLIREYLLTHTQTFAQAHLQPGQCRKFRVRRVRFNYDTEAWEDGLFVLPVLWGDFVLLTPTDMLARDDTWISYPDLVYNFSQIPEALPDDVLRGQVNNYFAKQLGANPKKGDRERAVHRT